MKSSDTERSSRWNNMWEKDVVIYNAQYGRPRDPRTFLYDKSHILEDAVKKNNLVGDDDNETMYNILMLVMNSIKYTGDNETKGQGEYWQNPEDTISLRKGDCEDGAILIKSLSLVAGIPDYKVRIAAGLVKPNGGHAYVVYVRDDDSQCILDWCYWPNRFSINDRKSFAEEENYYTVWFSFNKEYTFAAEPRKYGPQKKLI